MQSLVAIVSFQIFTLRQCLEHLENTNPAEGASQNDSDPYLSKTETIELITNDMIDIADRETVLAGPTILAWSIILQAIRLRLQSSEPEGGGLTSGSPDAIVSHDIYRR